MAGVRQWISVEPSINHQAVLGNLPFARGTVSFPIPKTVVPADATGILVFAWTALRGSNPGFAYWHFSVNNADGTTNWFSMLVCGDPTGASVTGNSQEFWLPCPADGTLSVTLFANDMPSPTNTGEVEIHGYYPAGS